MFVLYFPQDWLVVLVCCAVLATLIGLNLGKTYASLSSLRILFLLILTGVSVYGSINFDRYYLHKFKGEGTLPLPVNKCNTLETYLANLEEYQNPTFHEWKYRIDNPSCKFSSSLTVITSMFLSSFSVALIAMIFWIMLMRFRKSELIVNGNDVEFESFEDTGADPTIKEEKPTSPSSFYENWERFDLHSDDRDYRELLKEICGNFPLKSKKSNSIVACTELYKFLEKKTNLDENFKAGFVTKALSEKPQANVIWNTMEPKKFKYQGLGAGSVESILLWLACYLQKDLQNIIDDFVIQILANENIDDATFFGESLNFALEIKEKNNEES
ncbi:hypothetical protein C6Y40_11325 [Alteromonas alba]|uniref:Transmembrane protein n=1 Tax=Alteromonas alba TaxID=2079529 RepID=A0A2S9VAL7_9ALTE|nr:hypothetical protein [Alteromonas alba]PRO73498.1 hypothetical protein C6Y40_11325 [Alteromonas alba]